MSHTWPAAFGRLRVETSAPAARWSYVRPAAFGRLRVETPLTVTIALPLSAQPPSGGCVLKLLRYLRARRRVYQPPSGGCVLKLLFLAKQKETQLSQPPSGGCVLKHDSSPAASLRPTQPPSGGCVLKRSTELRELQVHHPAAFGRLRVETAVLSQPHPGRVPAAFGRLRVETPIKARPMGLLGSSRLRAAAC